jgi:hypothetical protein
MMSEADDRDRCGMCNGKLTVPYMSWLCGHGPIRRAGYSFVANAASGSSADFLSIYRASLILGRFAAWALITGEHKGLR